MYVSMYVSMYICIFPNDICTIQGNKILICNSVTHRHTHTQSFTTMMFLPSIEDI